MFTGRSLRKYRRTNRVKMGLLGYFGSELEASQALEALDPAFGNRRTGFVPLNLCDLAS